MSDRTPHGTAVLVPDVVTTRGASTDVVELVRKAWLASYLESTAYIYRSSTNEWFDFLAGYGVHPFEIRRHHLERYGKMLTARGLQDSSVAKKMGHVKSFYKYASIEEFIDKDPTAHARVPKIDDDVSRSYLDRQELTRFLAAAESLPEHLLVRDRALAVFMVFTGLRVSAALSANIETMTQERGHHTIVVRSKNRKLVTVPLVPRVRRAMNAYIGEHMVRGVIVPERTSGPVFLGREGARLDKHVAYQRIRRIAIRAGIDKPIGPHSLRRSFITNSLDAGIAMRDVQHSVQHKDPRTTARYDQRRHNLDTHAGYALSAFVPGG